jgi:hypothetical protein
MSEEVQRVLTQRCKAYGLNVASDNRVNEGGEQTRTMILNEEFVESLDLPTPTTCSPPRLTQRLRRLVQEEGTEVKSYTRLRSDVETARSEWCIAVLRTSSRTR